MGFYEERVLPRLVDLMCGQKELQRWRRQALEGLAGTVVEIGFGSGTNVPLYPAEVELVYAVEPAALARQLALKRTTGTGIRIEHVGTDGQSIPLPDASCDAAVATFVLCTIPDPVRAVAELRRVLKSGGRVHVLEHGRAPDPGVRAWQRRLEPINKRVAGGCHLTRDPVALFEAAGFAVDVRRRDYSRGPKPMTYFTVATATLTV